MAQWGRNDQGVTANSTTTIMTSNGAPNWTYAAVHGSGGGVSPVSMDANSSFGNTSPGSAANVDVNMYANSTVGAFINNMAVGVFAVTMNAISNTSQGGALGEAVVLTPGSGYGSNAVVTLYFAANGSSNTSQVNSTANSIGRIQALTVNVAGTGLLGEISVTIAPPGAQTFNAQTALTNTEVFNPNTGISGASNTFIAISSQKFSVNDKVEYTVSAGNTVPGGLANGTVYFVSGSNSSGLSIANTLGGVNLAINSTSHSETGHTFTFVTNNFIWDSSTPFQNEDFVTYTIAAGNTALSPLWVNVGYYIVNPNTVGFGLANTPDGPAITFIPGKNEAGHDLTGQTATGAVVIDSANTTGVPMVGWNLRREGTGGRAGRVQWECLVAMHSIGVNTTTSTGITGPANTVTANTQEATILPPG